jgi:hypothetical protein
MRLISEQSRDTTPPKAASKGTRIETSPRIAQTACSSKSPHGKQCGCRAGCRGEHPPCFGARSPWADDVRRKPRSPLNADRRNRRLAPQPARAARCACKTIGASDPDRTVYRAFDGKHTLVRGFRHRLGVRRPVTAPFVLEGAMNGPMFLA